MFPKDCNKVLELPFLTALLLHKEKDDDLLQSYMKCVTKWKSKNETKAFSMIGELLIPMTKEINPPKNYGTSQILNAFEKIKLIEKDLSRSEIKKIEKDLESNQDIFSKLIQSYFFIKQKNLSRSEKIWKEIISKDLYHYSYKTNIDVKYREKITEETISLLKRIQEISTNNKIFNLLLLHLSENTTGEIKQRIDQMFDISSEEIDDSVQAFSYNFGLAYPQIWFPIIYKNRGIVPAEKYLEKSDFYKKLSKGEYNLLKIITNFLPRESEKRDLILKSFFELDEQKDFYFKDLKFKLLSNENFKKIVILKKDKYKRPFFSQERNFYKNLLKNGVAIEYAIFKLIKLGDYNRSYLFYLQGI